MKIIKKGNLDKIKKIKRFMCNDCGCVFEATKDEYKIGWEYNEEYCYCNCPTCNEVVYSD